MRVSVVVDPSLREYHLFHHLKEFLISGVTTMYRETVVTSWLSCTVVDLFDTLRHDTPFNSGGSYVERVYSGSDRGNHAFD
ncbi:hypothetical protein AVEN_186033-1 [Araneus ventricosus]|uniref:Uncharacterized protein n=1 Tax=Araneus ventricosus TaxID=182803 RepID=A0A4Y2JDD3_ARAVE|nr:hypothetical protein AVEN_186033-1 [Araneus ventricosus]